MTDDQRTLLAHRMEQAIDMLDAARSERAAGRLTSAINRGYYAMFYAGLAPLSSQGIETSKHTGVVSKVSELFVRNGPLAPHLGRAMRQAFDLRQKSDYTAFFRPARDQADQVVAWAEEFVQETEKALASLGREGSA